MLFGTVQPVIFQHVHKVFQYGRGYPCGFQTGHNDTPCAVLVFEGISYPELDDGVSLARIMYAHIIAYIDEVVVVVLNLYVVNIRNILDYFPTFMSATSIQIPSIRLFSLTLCPLYEIRLRQIFSRVLFSHRTFYWMISRKL